MKPAATSPLTWLVAPMLRFTPVRDPAVPTGIPWVTPAAAFAALKASSSWSPSIVSPRWAANDRAVRIESEKPTRKMPPATPTSCTSSEPPTRGNARSGRPAGTGPAMATPCAARSSDQDATIPSTTTSSAAGNLGRKCRRPTSSSKETTARATVAALA